MRNANSVIQSHAGDVEAQRTQFVRDRSEIAFSVYNYGGRPMVRPEPRAPMRKQRFHALFARRAIGSIKKRERWAHVPVAMSDGSNGENAIEFTEAR